LHQTVAEDEKVDAVNKEEASDPKAAIPEGTEESEDNENSLQRS